MMPYVCGCPTLHRRGQSKTTIQHAEHARIKTYIKSYPMELEQAESIDVLVLAILSVDGPKTLTTKGLASNQKWALSTPPADAIDTTPASNFVGPLASDALHAPHRTSDEPKMQYSVMAFEGCANPVLSLASLLLACVVTSKSIVYVHTRCRPSWSTIDRLPYRCSLPYT
jgi:hypothetical protein